MTPREIIAKLVTLHRPPYNDDRFIEFDAVLAAADAYLAVQPGVCEHDAAFEAALPEQAGWAVEMHGACVLFANNAEKASGRSPGAKTQVFTRNQMRAIFDAAWNARGEADARVWRCFHCDEVFTTAETAELHFGRGELDKPACQISIEHIRWLEQQHHRGVQDDTEALRTIRTIVGEHEALRRRAEEQGYARGLADARKHPQELGLVAAPPLSGG
jgi:hypothetical protein